MGKRCAAGSLIVSMSTRATRTLSARGVRRLQDAPRFRSAGLRSSPSPLSRPDAVIARRQMFRSPTRVSAQTDAARRPAPLRGGGGGRSAPARSCWKNLSASRSQNASSIGAALSAVSSIDRCAMKNRERETEATEQEPVAAWWCVSTSSMAQYRRRKRGHECCRTLAASWAGRGTVVRGATDGDGGLA